MNTFHILGSSHATISMILESLFHLHGLNFRTRILQNIKIENDLPFQIEEVDSLCIPPDRISKEDVKQAILGVYKPSIKKIVYSFFKEHHQIDFDRYVNLIYPNSEIATTATIHGGVNIHPGVVVAPYSNIGKFVTINRLASIGHHTNIGDYVSINPGVHIAGNCNIGKGAMIGMGSCVVDGVSVGEGSVIGAGSLVTKDIPEQVVAYGSPAKIIKPQK